MTSKPSQGNLRRKVQAVDPKVMEQRLSHADAVVAALKVEYVSKLAEDLNALSKYADDALSALKAGDHDVMEKALEKLFQVSHNMKGQAATFGFPMLTDIAGSLCDLIVSGKGTDPRVHALIATHLQTANLLYRDNEKGAEIQKALQAVEALTQARERLLKK